MITQNGLSKPIDFIDLQSQQALIRDKVDLAIQKVLNHGQYIMGPEVEELEERLSDFCGAKYTVSCANGTAALELVLRAKNIGPGDAIFVPTFTFIATAEVVALVGATPVFVDVQADTFNMCPKSLEQAIHTAQKLNLKPKGIIPVDLFGLAADYESIHQIAKNHNLWVLGDGAQSFGASYKGKRVGNLTDVTTTSFFPAKPLGCYGDGGAIFTDDKELMTILKSLRVHGQGNERYHHVNIGTTGRLDTFQAAILIEKLKIFENEIEQRQVIAQRYNSLLADVVEVPNFFEGHISAWAQYTLKLPHDINRTIMMAHLKEKGIPTMVYYPIPIHAQPAYKHYPCATGMGGLLPVSEALSACVLSLPMHPYLTESIQEYITNTVMNYMKTNHVTI